MKNERHNPYDRDTPRLQRINTLLIASIMVFGLLIIGLNLSTPLDFTDKNYTLSFSSAKKRTVKACRLEVGDTDTLMIRADEKMSGEFLVVKPGEKYTFKVDSTKNRWVDFFIPTDADGFNNLLLKEKSKRLPGEKCFKLCAIQVLNDTCKVFPVGLKKEWDVMEEGKLHFFANDGENWYWNNFGKIRLIVFRKK